MSLFLFPMTGSHIAPAGAPEMPLNDIQPQKEAAALVPEST
jgi:hypothetical protein